MKYERREWLIKIRKNKGLTQEEVAKRCNIERSTYTKAEIGYPIHIKTAKIIAEILDFQWIKFFEEK